MPDEAVALPPNALTEWPAIEARLAGRTLAVFLDYDGTLAPIVQRPELAVLSAQTRAVLHRLAEQMPVAIVSGRGLENAMERVGIDGLIYGGSHGFDISGPNGMRLEHGLEHRPAIEQALAEFRAATPHMAGVVVEDKRFSISLHYRLANDEDAARLRGLIDEVLVRCPGLRTMQGKKIIEVLPSVAWDKGKAVYWVLDALGLERETALPIFIGDDVTDEDAFAAVEGHGIGIVVARTPRGTRAEYSLSSVEEVCTLLERIVNRPR